MPPSGSARIAIGSLFAWVRPAEAAALVTSALGYTRTTFATNRSGNFEKQQRMETFYAREEDSSVRILVGHVGRAKDLLERAGLTVVVEDQRRFSAKAAPNLPLIAAAQGSTRRLLEILAREPRGLIEVQKRIDVLWLMAEICRLFPAARIYLPVGTRRQVFRTRREFQRILHAPVHVVEDYPWPWEGGRLVCTYQTFDRHNADDLEVVICPDATLATVPAHIKAFGALPHQRVYGIRPGQSGIQRPGTPASGGAVWFDHYSHA